MALVNVNDVTWDIVDGDGQYLRAGPEPARAMQLPRRWRVFGPFGADMTDVHIEPGVVTRAKPKATPDPGQLATMADQLTVGDTTLKGVDVDMADNLLDFGALYGGHDNREGCHAYALAELEVQQDTELILGAGADWWMQWWIDGQPVFDTLATGNGPHLFRPTDHCFRHQFTAGKHVLAALVLRGSAATWSIRTDTVTARDEAFSKRNPNQWSFLTDPDEVHPPAGGTELHKAFRTDLTLADETIECEYQLSFSHGHIGIVFGAQDADHYYWAYIPQWGQLWRGRAYYAVLAIADGTGYLRHLDLKLMPNVPCHLNIWRSMRVERRGSRIQMWINGVKGPSADDDTYGPGRVGASGFNRCAIRNLQIDGKQTDAPAWPISGARRRNFAEPFAAESDYNFHSFHTINQLASGRLLMVTNKIRAASPFVDDPGKTTFHLYMSDDAGRTWSPHGEPFVQPPGEPLGYLHEIQPGTLRAMVFRDDPPGAAQECETFTEGSGFYYRDSQDEAVTWSSWRYSKLNGDWHAELFGDNAQCIPAGFAQLRDGTLLTALLRNTHRPAPVDNMGQGTWPTNWMPQPYCTVSTDQGRSWSQPAPMDNAALQDGDPPDSPVADFTETPIAELPSGRIIAMSRPCAAPFMWQTYSTDGGRTWQQACYAPFSGSGGPALVVTHSGYLVLVARCTGVGMHISTDEGANWTSGAMLDSPACFNGGMLEVEPDVVLVIYHVNIDVPAHIRTQRIAITPDGPVPADT